MRVRGSAQSIRGSDCQTEGYPPICAAPLHPLTSMPSPMHWPLMKMVVAMGRGNSASLSHGHRKGSRLEGGGRNECTQHPAVRNKGDGSTLPYSLEVVLHQGERDVNATVVQPREGAVVGGIGSRPAVHPGGGGRAWCV